ncbi:hypothetical protein ACQ4PT_065649 [Festuca glaucescens]
MVLSRETPEIVDLDWENLGFTLVNTDFMYMAKCGPDGNFSKGEMLPFGPIALSPSAGVLNYGQGLFEGLKAYRKTDGSVLLFRPEENARRMIIGADRMCMPAPTVEQFVDAVKQTVLANKRWVPPTGKGSLYIRPLLIGSGAILGVAPAPEFTFIIYVSPVGNYFKVLKAQRNAKEKGYSDVLYLDAVHNKYLEEVSASNIFVVKVEERPVSVDELFVADEVFCTGTAVVVSPVGSITYQGKRVAYDGNQGAGVVSQQLYTSLTGIQMGLSEDRMGWTVQLN